MHPTQPPALGEAGVTGTWGAGQGSLGPHSAAIGHSPFPDSLPAIL